MEADRLPPHAPDAEKAIIGCCLTDPKDCVPQVQQILSLEAFYEVANQTAMKSIFEMNAEAVNIISIGENSGISVLYLNECQDTAFSTANLSEWIRLVQEKHTLRQVIRVCSGLIQESYAAKDSIALLDKAESSILKIRPEQRESKDIKALVQQATALIEFRAMNWDKITGLPTGLTDLDALTDGLHASEMIVLAAFPSCGKTALAVNVATLNAILGKSVGILTAEMRPVQLVVRSICSQSRVNFKKASESDIPKMVVSAAAISKAKIHIEQVSGCTIGQVQATARRMKQQHRIEMLVVDYIQLIQGVGDNREQQVASVGSGLKAIAMELEIPVIALSQLNDDGKLRESRKLGQDADSVWVLSNEGEWQPKDQPVRLKVEKCRDGETGIVNLIFRKQFTRFESASPITDNDVPTAYRD